MSLGVNNQVAFCGKNNGAREVLKKLEQKNEIKDKLANELAEVAKRSKAEQKKATTVKIVDKLGVKAQKEMELKKRPIADQMEVMIRESALATSFKEKIRKILGRIL